MALPHIDAARLQRLRAVDDALGVALKSGDVQSYMEGNFEFHFTDLPGPAADARSSS